jgi:hypothetical protein
MNLVNAMTLVTRAVENKKNLEYISARITRDLIGSDYESAAFAFEVLNSQCGGNLPTPTFMTSNDTQCGLCASQGREFDFRENVEMASDLLNAMSKMENSTTTGMGKLMLAGMQSNIKTEELLRAIGMLYPVSQ